MSCATEGIQRASLFLSRWAAPARRWATRRRKPRRRPTCARFVLFDQYVFGCPCFRRSVMRARAPEGRLPCDVESPTEGAGVAGRHGHEALVLGAWDCGAGALGGVMFASITMETTVMFSPVITKPVAATQAFIAETSLLVASDGRIESRRVSSFVGRVSMPHFRAKPDRWEKPSSSPSRAVPAPPRSARQPRP